MKAHWCVFYFEIRHYDIVVIVVAATFLFLYEKEKRDKKNII